MTTCGSLNLNHILSESPAFLESITPWKNLILKSMNPCNNDSGIFLQPSSSTPCNETNGSSDSHQENYYYKDYPPMSGNYQNLSLCTEGLGFESFDDVEGLLSNEGCNNTACRNQEEERSSRRNADMEDDPMEQTKRSGLGKSGAFPPPISCIGRNGKPWVCFKKFRQDGRFILKEIRVPTQEFLQACRENGRLKLQFAQSDDDVDDGDEICGQGDEEERNGQEEGNCTDNLGNGKEMN